MTSVGTADSEESSSYITPVYHRLLCISTAFELLSGQGKRVIFSPLPPLKTRNITRLNERPGEALNVDLSDFVNHLYAIIPSIGILSETEDHRRPRFGKARRCGEPRGQWLRLVISSSDAVPRAPPDLFS
jgi:hypothetical protein